MSLWFSATAAAPAIAADSDSTPATVAWLTMAVQAGFVAGTLVTAVTNLADTINSRRLFGAGCVAGAAPTPRSPPPRPRPRSSSCGS